MAIPVSSDIVRAGTSAFDAGGGGGATWTSYATMWDTAPTFNATISAGTVFNYTYNGVTRYRLVPSPYDSSLDAFYGAFDGDNLTSLLVVRGT
jgi:hypothetical protein